MIFADTVESNLASNLIWVNGAWELLTFNHVLQIWDKRNILTYAYHCTEWFILGAKLIETLDLLFFKKYQAEENSRELWDNVTWIEHCRGIMVIYQKIKATTSMENTLKCQGKVQTFISRPGDIDPVKSHCEGELFLVHLMIDADYIVLSEECCFRTAPSLYYCNLFVWTSASSWHYIGDMWLFISSWLWVSANPYLFLWLAVCKILILENNPPSADNDIHWFFYYYYSRNCCGTTIYRFYPFIYIY